MRQFVAIVLIVCGTLLAMAPTASEFVQREQVAQLASEQHGVGQVNFIAQPLEEGYRVGAWILGIGMIGLGIIGGWRHEASVRASNEMNDERLLARAG